MSRKRVLITGAAGFVGLQLGNHLASKGHEVIGVDLSTPGSQGGARFHLECADFRDTMKMRTLLDGTDVIYHLAAAHLSVTINEADYTDINVGGLTGLLEGAATANIGRFVHVSSVGVYGDLPSWPADEETTCMPQTIYGETKLAGERVVQEFGTRTGFPFVIFRPAWIYGSTCPRTRKIYTALRKNRFVMIGSGQNQRHPIYIRDALEALDRGMTATEVVGETIILGGPSTHTSSEIIRSMCNVFGFRFPLIKLPYSLGYMLAAGVQTGFSLIGRETPISTRTMEFFRTNNAFDVSKSKRLLNYQPAFSLEDGLKDACEQLKQSV